MTLDPNYPLDTEMVAKLPWWIRQVVGAITSSSISYNAYALDAIDTEIAGDAVAIEVIAVSGNAAASIVTLGGGAAGRIKIIIAQNANITLIDGSDNIDMRGNPLLPDFPMQAGDIICFIYRPLTGMWVEVFRSLA